ncbi:MAG TPA: hypothetical protein VG097_03855 [Gemmata sp.]|nr:hypothetical protein [Gemmata sp.]
MKSRGYRLARDYRRVRRIICTDEKLNRKIRVLSLRQDAKLLPVHYWLKSHFVRLHFDGERAASIIATLTPDDDCKLEVEEYRLMLTGYCQRIADGEHRLSCDRFGRVHTHITSLKKELRSCLSVDGQPIVGWDLANSQPLIAGLLARRFCRSPSVQSRMSNATFKDENNPYCYKALAELTHHSSVKDDVQEYLRCCEEGAFYESFGDDREKVKKGFMSILMGPIKYKGSVKADFNNKFPTVATMLHSLKLKDYRRVAWLLQNLEATIFIHRVCGRLMDEHPKLPVYTIHDSIYTIPRGRNIIKRVILEEFDRFGIVPTLKHC